MLTPLLSYPNEGILIVRLVMGYIFIIHGLPKTSGKMGSFMAFIGAAETAGALALITGFLTQWASLGIGIIMLGAIYMKIVKWHVPFTAMDKSGWEFDLMILAGCTALLTFGAGTYSADAFFMS